MGDNEMNKKILYKKEKEAGKEQSVILKATKRTINSCVREQVQ